MGEPRRTATALSYDAGRGGAPRVVAQGRGVLAERIAAAAEQAGVPVREDPMLAEALALLDVDADIPEQLFVAVAEALVWAWKADASMRRT